MRSLPSHPQSPLLLENGLEEMNKNSGGTREDTMRRSRNPASTTPAQTSSPIAGPSGSSNSTNTVPSLLKELHGLVLQIQVHSAASVKTEKLYTGSLDCRDRELKQ